MHPEKDPYSKIDYYRTIKYMTHIVRSDWSAENKKKHLDYVKFSDEI